MACGQPARIPPDSDGQTPRVFVTLLHRFGTCALDRIRFGRGQQTFDDPRQVVAHRFARALRIMFAQRRQYPAMFADPRFTVSTIGPFVLAIRKP